MKRTALLPAAAVLGVLAGPRPAVGADTVFVDPATASAMVESGAVVIDARGPKAHGQGHVPGAQPLAWTSLRDGLLKVGRLTDDMGRLQSTFRGLGVDDDEPVVVYDAGLDGWGEAGRIWWTLRYLGLEQVHIIDGGLPAWEAAGQPVTTAASVVVPGTFVPVPDERLRARLSEVERAVAAQGADAPTAADVPVLWDTREPREYAGATPYGEARGGHLPGAVGLHFKALLGPDGRLLPRAALEALLTEHGIRPDRPVIAYCTGGVRSGFAVAVLEELGYPDAANYDGSMWEWAADREHPLVPR